MQGGGEQGTRAIDVPTRIVTDRHLEATRTIEPDESLDLVVWPENVIDTVDFATSEQLQLVAAEAARLGVPFAVGITEDVPGQPGRVTNAQVVVTPDGEVTSRYDKVRRVPFGEYVPLRGLLEAPRRAGRPGADERRSPGTGPAVIDLPDGTRLAVVISWEVFFGGRAREGVKNGGRGHPQPDQRRQLHRHDRADPAGRVEPAAGDRDRTVAGAGRRRPGSPSSSRPTAT